jgi:hypothetical protein
VRSRGDILESDGGRSADETGCGGEVGGERMALRRAAGRICARQRPPPVTGDDEEVLNPHVILEPHREPPQPGLIRARVVGEADQYRPIGSMAASRALKVVPATAGDIIDDDVRGAAAPE